MNRFIVANVSLALWFISHSALCQEKSLVSQNLSVKQNDLSPIINNDPQKTNTLIPNNSVTINNTDAAIGITQPLTPNTQMIKADLYLNLQEFISQEVAPSAKSITNNPLPPSALTELPKVKKDLAGNPPVVTPTPAVGIPPVVTPALAVATSPVASTATVKPSTGNDLQKTSEDQKIKSDGSDILDSLIDFKSVNNTATVPAAPAATPSLAPTITNLPSKDNQAAVSSPTVSNLNTANPALAPAPSPTPSIVVLPNPIDKNTIQPLPESAKISISPSDSSKTKEIIDTPLPEDAQDNKSGSLNTNDAAFIGMMEEKRNSLPKDKRLSPKTDQAISDITNQMVRSNTGNKNIQYIDISRDKILPDDLLDSPPSQDSKKSKSKMNLSVREGSDKNDSQDRSSTLNTANKALISGQISAAIRIYKTLLEKDKNDIDALFGLASAYQRDGQLDKASEIYHKILKSHPHHKEALNNFLALAAEESPDDALIELQKLERINQGFSPIQAQIAMIYLKTNRLTQAEVYFKRALELSPDNLIYQYNLAITLDKLAKYSQAIPLYQKVLDGSKQGAAIPGSYNQISERFNYLRSRY